MSKNRWRGATSQRWFVCQPTLKMVREAGTLSSWITPSRTALGRSTCVPRSSNPDRHFWPGQFVDVKLLLTTQKQAVLIPNQAAQISQKGPFVYVVKPDDTAELQSDHARPAFKATRSS